MSVEPHLLIVTVERCGACPPDTPCADCAEVRELDYTVTCPGVDVGQCEAWEECMTCNRAVNNDDVDLIDQLHSEEPVHGQVHAYLGGYGWGVKLAPARCAVLAGDYVDAASDMVSEPGTYRVFPHWEDEWVTFEHHPDERPCSTPYPQRREGRRLERCAAVGLHDQHFLDDGTTWADR